MKMIQRNGRVFHALGCACMLSCFSCIWLFATLWTVTCQAPLSLGFSRQEYWSGLPYPPPGDLPNPGIEPRSLNLLHWQGDSFTAGATGKPIPLEGKNYFHFHCRNDYATQSNLQIQHNPYQIINGIFLRTWTKKFTICMETQKTPNSQSHLEKEKQSWRNQSSWFQTVLQSTVIKTVWY